MQFPVLGLLDVLYQQHLDLANGVIDAAISLAGIYFSFALMPAMDAVLGTDLHPKSPVSTESMPFTRCYPFYIIFTWVQHHLCECKASMLPWTCIQAERKVASEDMRYRTLLWTWVGLHCGLLLLCADAVHGHNMHPLACLGQYLKHAHPMKFATCFRQGCRQCASMQACHECNSTSVLAGS